MRDLCFFGFCILCLLALIWPGYPLAMTIDATPLGLPWSLLWNLIWIAASFFALLAYHLTRPHEA